MTNYLVRFAKRFALLLPGIVIAYFSVRDIFPTIDKRLPASLAIFLTYVIGAYVLIPALVRVVRIFVPERHLPTYCITPDGFASDPLNIALIGSRDQLISAMQGAGWFVADHYSPTNIIRSIFAALTKRPYPTAPMSNLFLFGRKQDIGFEIPVEDSRGHRHHVRFWATRYEKGNPLSFKGIHWQDRAMQRRGGDLMWVGAASRDVGFAPIRHNMQITHMISPDTNAERALISTQLLTNKSARLLGEIRLGRPYWLLNRAWLGYLHSDGMLRVLKLK